jgi:RecB family endonuclease NucS
VIEPLYARLAVTVRAAAAELFVGDEAAGSVLDSFWAIAGEHLELQGLAPDIGVRPLREQITEWLAEHVHVLTTVYGPVELAPEARLVAVGDGHARVDVAVRRSGGWVLTLVRRGVAGLVTLAQLDRSLDVARETIAIGDDTIEGLLVAERATPELLDALAERADVRFTDVATLLQS